MNKLSITDAAKAAGVSRSHLYKRYINTGKISVEIRGSFRYHVKSNELR